MTQWYYASLGGETIGPHPPEDIESLFLIGELTRDTLLWRKGLPQWTALAEVPEFKGLLRPEPPPIPKVARVSPAATHPHRPPAGPVNGHRQSRWIYVIHACGAGVLASIVANTNFPVQGAIVAAVAALLGWSGSIAIVAAIDRMELSSVARRLVLILLPLIYFMVLFAGFALFGTARR